MRVRLGTQIIPAPHKYGKCHPEEQLGESLEDGDNSGSYRGEDNICDDLQKQAALSQLEVEWESGESEAGSFSAMGDLVTRSGGGP